MPLDGQCPDCGESLKPRARKCSCGWAQTGGKALAIASPVDLFRCEWETNGERCRYPGAHSHSTLGGGPWYCSGHMRSGGAVGQRIVEESRSVRFGSYTAEAMVNAAREAYLRRPLPPLGPPAEGVRWRQVGQLQHAADIVRAHLREPGQEG